MFDCSIGVDFVSFSSIVFTDFIACLLLPNSIIKCVSFFQSLKSVYDTFNYSGKLIIASPCRCLMVIPPLHVFAHRMHRLIDIQWCCAAFWLKIINLLKILQLFNDSNWPQLISRWKWRKEDRTVMNYYSSFKRKVVDDRQRAFMYLKSSFRATKKCDKTHYLSSTNFSIIYDYYII